MKSGVLITLLVVSFSAGSARAAESPTPAPPAAVPVTITLATTTSVENSGLLDALLPRFEKESGIEVKVVAVGTGAALRIAREGNADLVLVHDPEAEEKFVGEGWGTERIPIMYNYFWIVGPKEDPAGIEGVAPEGAFRKIAETHSPFVSRGDNSGTHTKELSLWEKAGIRPSGEWYLESGQGMIESLRIASQKRAYILTDNATYLFHRSELSLEPLITGGAEAIKNTYSLIPLSPARHPQIKQAEAQKLVDFIRSPAIQEMIGQYGRERAGEPLFYVSR